MFSVSQKLTSIFTDIANAIRTKLNFNLSIAALDFPDVIDCATKDLFDLKMNDSIEKIIDYRCISIPVGAFYSCSTLTHIKFPNCSIINSYAFKYCSSLSYANFSSCTKINIQAFQYCRNLSQINLPICETIEKEAFEFCENLTEINLPMCTSLNTTIGSQGAFRGCYHLSTVKLSVCSIIGSSTFSTCERLMSVYLYNSSLCVLNNINAFYSTPISDFLTYTQTYGSIFVPSSLVTEYKNATNWTAYTNRIFAIPENEVN